MSARLVHGYLCVEEPDDTQMALLCKDMLRFCQMSDFRLGTVFIDRGVPDGVFARIGFSRLLEALHRPEAHAVVVPSLDYLSSQAFVRDALMRMVLLTDSLVLTAYQTNDCASALDGEPDSGGLGARS